MKVLIAADHAGFAYKEILVALVKEVGYEVLDLGTDGKDESDDYPDYASAVASALLNSEGDRGILICGSAVGVSIAANKFPGIRAAACSDAYTAHQCVEHDDVNILCLGERTLGIEVAKEIVLVFLKAAFTNKPRHQRRLKKISAIELKNMKETHEQPQ